MTKHVIEINDVTKYFGEIHAVDGVNLTFEKGELFGLIGHNGAGKSTLFKMMLGLLPVTSGQICIYGQPIHGETFRQARRRIGYLPENVVFYDNLTGLETLYFFADLKGADKRTCAAILETVGLAHAANRRVRGYSKGMRQRLGFAQALLGKPDILFLDEPTNGLDPEAIREFYQVLRGLQDQGVTMILTSHILAEIQERVDRLAIMKSGKIQALGTLQGLREEIDLPLHFQVGMQHGAETALREKLGSMEQLEIRTEGLEASITCARDKKMAVLNALSSLEGAVCDIIISEPSLEDVFLGYGAKK
ncbi:MAG: ABC transporter ATP-binding protein [Gallionellaceae bacterium]|nr:ABC transporter ATP-binding protein [Gallionellaceae bacterium]